MSHNTRESPLRGVNSLCRASMYLIGRPPPRPCACVCPAPSRPPGNDVLKEPFITKTADALGCTPAQVVLRWLVQQVPTPSSSITHTAQGRHPRHRTKPPISSHRPFTCASFSVAVAVAVQGIAVVPNSLCAEHIVDNVDLETIQLADLRVQALYEMSDIRQVRLGQLPTDKVRPSPAIDERTNGPERASGLEMVHHAARSACRWWLVAC